MPHYSRIRGATNMQNLGTFLGFFLATVAVSLRWSLVSLHPLGFEANAVGIHNRQPHYLPAYNGIFSIHAMNFSSTVDTSSVGQQIQANSSLSPDERDERTNASEQQDIQLFPEDGTGANEVDSKHRHKFPEQTTFPQLHVITQTISDVTAEDAGDTVEQEDEETVVNDTTTELIQTGSETLLEGPEDDSTTVASEDIFDRLMRTIQGHWLDFVGKMKLSVLDVWKSISHHMMERLENFATAL